MTLHKNHIYQGEVIDYTEQGIGILIISNKKILVQHVLLGEKIEFKLIKLTKTYGIGKCITILKESADRVIPKCPIYKQCGGCQLQHMSYSAQLEFKKKKLKHTLDKFKLNIPNINTYKSSEFNYRNKLQLSIQKQGSKTVIGLYRTHSHDVVDMEYCEIANSLVNENLNAIRKVLTQNSFSIYDERKKEGLLKYVIIRGSELTRQSQLCVVMRHYCTETIEKILTILKKPTHLKSIIVNVNPDDSDILLGKDYVNVYGTDFIEERIGDLRLKLNTPSFFQINTEQCNVLYKNIKSSIEKGSTVLDAHCGVGSISSFIGKKAAYVIGVDNNNEAIKLARINQELNKLDHLTFYESNVGDILPKLQSNKFIDSIILDPPRSGCEISLLNELKANNIQENNKQKNSTIADNVKEDSLEENFKHVIYVSCNKNSLSKDLNTLSKYYYISSMAIIDMFPQTYHCEVITILKKSC